MAHEILGKIFDCDGTLVYTMEAHYLAFCGVLQGYGDPDVLFPKELFYDLAGVPTMQICMRIVRDHDLDVKPADLAQSKRQAFLHDPGIVITPTPITNVARAYHGWLPMAVASGGTRDTVEHSLQRVGILNWFDVLVTADDVQNPKPHPETFLKAAEAIGIAPENCIAYEDSDLGIASAQAAGIGVVMDVRPTLKKHSA